MAPAAPAVGNPTHDRRLAADHRTRLLAETAKALNRNTQSKGPVRNELVHSGPSAAGNHSGTGTPKSHNLPPVSMLPARFWIPESSTTADVTVKMEIDEVDERPTALTKTFSQNLPTMATPSLPREEQEGSAQRSRPNLPTPVAGGFGRTAKLLDEDQADLQLWLEVTGYHDKEYRTSKLHAFRERQTLEAEAARISSRLQELKQNEVQVTGRRNSSRLPAVSDRLAPSAPSNGMQAVFGTKQGGDTPSVKPSATTNGIKRAHSPEPSAAAKAPRWSISTFVPPCNVADPASDPRLLGPTKANGPSEESLQRNISYPEPRWKPADNHYRTVIRPPEPASAPVVRLPPAHPRNFPASNHERLSNFKFQILGSFNLHTPIV